MLRSDGTIRSNFPVCVNGTVASGINIEHRWCKTCALTTFEERGGVVVRVRVVSLR